MKTGQVDGAVLSTQGLSKFYAPVRALELPGVITSYTQLASALSGTQTYFENGLKSAGATPLGWLYFGDKYLMSNNYPVAQPSDLKGKKPVTLRDGYVEQAFYQTITGVTGVPLNVPEVLPNLNTGAVDSIPYSIMLAEQLQWTSKLNTFNDQLFTISSGGIVISSTRFRALPADLQSILTDTGKIAANSLTTRIQTLSGESIARVKSTKTVVTPNAAAFSSVFATTSNTFTTTGVPASLIAYLRSPTTTPYTG
jgi:TRAP-type C4-dicarboxylate transport system substrate-binding protein